MRRLDVVLCTAAVAVSVTGCSAPASSSACHSEVEVGPVPAWANAGFSEGARVPRVVGAAGRILAVHFTDSLVAADGPEPVNKVLFVPRVPLRGPSPLTIEARLEGHGDVVRRVRMDGPGPGSLDLPTPGCWRLKLSWADQTDTLDLEYVSPTATPSGASSSG